MIVFCAKDFFTYDLQSLSLFPANFFFGKNLRRTKCAAAALQEPKEKKACSVFFSDAEKQEDRAFVFIL